MRAVPTAIFTIGTASKPPQVATPRPRPMPRPNEVRVKVVASAVNAGEVISGDFVGRFLHVMTKPLVLGWDFSGLVDAVGEGVTDLPEVWGSPRLRHDPAVGCLRGVHHGPARRPRVQAGRRMMWSSIPPPSQRCHFVQVASKRADLKLVGGWLSDGLQIPIDSRHPISELAAALARQTDRAWSGRVVVDVEDGWPAQ